MQLGPDPGPQRPARHVGRRRVPGLKLAAQAIHVGQDLAAQLPAVRTFRGVGGQQVRQPVLLALGLLQVIFQHQRQRWLGLRVRGIERLGIGLDELAVGAHAGGQFGDDGGQPGAGLLVLDRAVPAVQPGAVGDRAGQHAQVRGGPLQRVDSVAQAGGRVAVPESAGIQPDALLGLGERVVHPLDLAAQRPGAVQPLRRAARVGLGGQAVGHLAEQVGHLAGQVADRVLGGLYPQRREEQARGQPGGGPHQGFGDAAGRGGV